MVREKALKAVGADAKTVGPAFSIKWLGYKVEGFGLGFRV